MASARAPKRHGRLASLFGLGKVAGATISRLLDKVQREPEVLEGSHKRKTLDRALVTNIEEISCFVTLKLEKGGDEQWQVLSLAKATRELASQCASFRELLQWLYTARPCTPSCRWHLIVYFDETTPGDLLRLDNKRKNHGHLCVSARVRSCHPAARAGVDSASGDARHLVFSGPPT